MLRVRIPEPMLGGKLPGGLQVAIMTLDDLTHLRVSYGAALPGCHEKFCMVTLSRPAGVLVA
jgi:hypothetical protein